MAWNTFFGRKFHFGRPKTNFSGFEKWKKQKKKKKKQAKKKKKKKKKGPLPFCNFPTFLFKIFLQLFFFSSPFPPPFSLFSLPLFFQVGQQKFPCQKSLGGTLPPPACYATANEMTVCTGVYGEPPFWVPVSFCSHPIILKSSDYFPGTEAMNQVPNT